MFSCSDRKVCATNVSPQSQDACREASALLDNERNHIFWSHFKKRVVNMVLLKDLTFPDSGRLLHVSTDSTNDDSGGPFNQVAISVAGVGLILSLLLLCTIWCICSVRSGLATRGVVNVTSATVPPQDERAGDTIQSTLQRKHAILELFRASQVTMVSYEVYPL